MKIIFKTIVMALALCCVVFTNAYAQTVSNLTFKDTDIKVVLQAITQLAKNDNKDINIVPSSTLTGTVTIDLTHVNWQAALDVICQAYNLESYRHNNVIIVTPIGPNGSALKNEIGVKAFNLKYIDANDALKAITPILSKDGKTSVLETTGQSGWQFGMQAAGATGSQQASPKLEATDKKLRRTKVLIVSDSNDRLEKISALLDQLDVMPKQILIKARILEVDHDFVRDLGIDFGTALTGATGTIQTIKGNPNANIGVQNQMPAAITPSAFTPQTTALSTANSGFQFLYQQVSGSKYEILLHALEENTKTNELSAPVLVTLNNQEATILVGTQYPIIQTEVSTTSTTTSDIVGGSLQYYQNIGIQLNVVPQIWGEKEDYINLIIHPTVSSYSATAGVKDQSGDTLVAYPVINTREAETQLVVPDNGTVIMGGLINDVITDQIIGVPFLSQIPYLGKFFNRHVKNTKKVELIIFITAHIMAPDEQVSPSVINVKGIEKHFTDKK